MDAKRSMWTQKTFAQNLPVNSTLRTHLSKHIAAVNSLPFSLTTPARTQCGVTLWLIFKMHICTSVYMSFVHMRLKACAVKQFSVHLWGHRIHEVALSPNLIHEVFLLNLLGWSDGSSHQRGCEHWDSQGLCGNRAKAVPLQYVFSHICLSLTFMCQEDRLGQTKRTGNSCSDSQFLQTCRSHS